MNICKVFLQKILLICPILLVFAIQGCQETHKEVTEEIDISQPEYFTLRPEVEKLFGYTRAVKIGNVLKISGAVSMDTNGMPTAIGNMEEQMKNCYSDLEKILKRYGYTFDDVVEENIFTTNMASFLQFSPYRSSIYKKQFPTGTWLEVKGLASPEFLIEIELEAYRSK